MPQSTGFFSAAALLIVPSHSNSRVFISEVVPTSNGSSLVIAGSFSGSSFSLSPSLSLHPYESAKDAVLSSFVVVASVDNERDGALYPTAVSVLSVSNASVAVTGIAAKNGVDDSDIYVAGTFMGSSDSDSLVFNVNHAKGLADNSIVVSASNSTSNFHENFAVVFVARMMPDGVFTWGTGFPASPATVVESEANRTKSTETSHTANSRTTAVVNLNSTLSSTESALAKTAKTTLGSTNSSSLLFNSTSEQLKSLRSSSSISRTTTSSPSPSATQPSSSTSMLLNTTHYSNTLTASANISLSLKTTVTRITSKSLIPQPADKDDFNNRIRRGGVATGKNSKDSIFPVKLALDIDGGVLVTGSFSGTMLLGSFHINSTADSVSAFMAKLSSDDGSPLFANKLTTAEKDDAESKSKKFIVTSIIRDVCTSYTNSYILTGLSAESENNQTIRTVHILRIDLLNQVKNTADRESDWVHVGSKTTMNILSENIGHTTQNSTADEILALYKFLPNFGRNKLSVASLGMVGGKCTYAASTEFKISNTTVHSSVYALTEDLSIDDSKEIIRQDSKFGPPSLASAAGILFISGSVDNTTVKSVTTDGISFPTSGPFNYLLGLDPATFYPTSKTAFKPPMDLTKFKEAAYVFNSPMTIVSAGNSVNSLFVYSEVKAAKSMDVGENGHWFGAVNTKKVIAYSEGLVNGGNKDVNRTPESTPKPVKSTQKSVEEGKAASPPPTYAPEKATPSPIVTNAPPKKSSKPPAVVEGGPGFDEKQNSKQQDSIPADEEFFLGTEFYFIGVLVTAVVIGLFLFYTAKKRGLNELTRGTYKPAAKNDDMESISGVSGGRRTATEVPSVRLENDGAIVSPVVKSGRSILAPVQRKSIDPSSSSYVDARASFDASPRLEVGEKAPLKQSEESWDWDEASLESLNAPKKSAGSSKEKPDEEWGDW